MLYKVVTGYRDGDEIKDTFGLTFERDGKLVRTGTIPEEAFSELQDLFTELFSSDEDEALNSLFDIIDATREECDGKEIYVALCAIG